MKTIKLSVINNNALRVQVIDDDREEADCEYECTCEEMKRREQYNKAEELLDPYSVATVVDAQSSDCALSRTTLFNVLDDMYLNDEFTKKARECGIGIRSYSMRRRPLYIPTNHNPASTKTFLPPKGLWEKTVRNALELSVKEASTNVIYQALCNARKAVGEAMTAARDAMRLFEDAAHLTCTCHVPTSMQGTVKEMVTTFPVRVLHGFQTRQVTEHTASGVEAGKIEVTLVRASNEIFEFYVEPDDEENVAALRQFEKLFAEGV